MVLLVKKSFVVPALAGLLRSFPPKGGTTNVSSWLQHFKMRIAGQLARRRETGVKCVAMHISPCE